MTEFFLSEWVQLVLIGLGMPLLFLVFLMVVGLLAQLFSQFTCSNGTGHGFERSQERCSQRPRAPHLVRTLIARDMFTGEPLPQQRLVLHLGPEKRCGELTGSTPAMLPLIETRQSASPQLPTGPSRETRRPSWTQTGSGILMPPALPVSPLPSMHEDDFDDDDDEKNNPFIDLRLLRGEFGQPASVDAKDVSAPCEEIEALLVKYLEFGAGVDVLLRDGIPVGHPSIGYDHVSLAELSDEEAGRVFDAAGGSEKIEACTLSGGQEEPLDTTVIATPVMVIG